jgi:hypothetical protein
MSRFNKIYLSKINKLQAIYRGMETNVEAAQIHFEREADCLG